MTHVYSNFFRAVSVRVRDFFFDSVSVDPIAAGGWKPPVDGTREQVDFFRPPHRYRFLNVKRDKETYYAYSDSRIACVCGSSDNPEHNSEHSTIAADALVYWSPDKSLFDFKPDRAVILRLADTIAGTVQGDPVNTDPVDRDPVNAEWKCMRRVSTPDRWGGGEIADGFIVLRSRMITTGLDECEVKRRVEEIEKLGGQIEDRQDQPDSISILEQAPMSSVLGVVYACVDTSSKRIAVVRAS